MTFAPCTLSSDDEYAVIDGSTSFSTAQLSGAVQEGGSPSTPTVGTIPGGRALGDILRPSYTRAPGANRRWLPDKNGFVNTLCCDAPIEPNCIEETSELD